LRQATEIDDLDARLNASATALRDAADLNDAPMIEFTTPLHATLLPRLLEGVRIAIARDAAFAFLYQANLDLLARLGAQLLYFSPLIDTTLPPADAVYLPGGYPELHAAALAANVSMHRALRNHHAAGKPLLAECGGMMFLFEHLTDLNGQRHTMTALLPGETTMQPKLQAIALQSVDLGGGELRGHSFHYSQLSTPRSPSARGVTQHGTQGEVIFQDQKLTASYVHFYFPSNPQAAARLFQP